MTCLDPNSTLGRAILAGKLRREKVTKRRGEDAADAFIRGLIARNPGALSGLEAFVEDLQKEHPK